MFTNTVVTKRIDQELCKLYHINDNGDPVPYVCLICDRFLKKDEVKIIGVPLLLKNVSLLTVDNQDHTSLHDCNYDIPQVLRQEYTVNESNLTIDNKWMFDMLLSPCATVLLKDDGWYKDGFASCTSCKHALEHYNMPRFAIANANWFGSTPTCLLDLSRIELALLSPVKKFGYCFMYTGGALI
jgi:hypothetical protein